MHNMRGTRDGINGPFTVPGGGHFDWYNGSFSSFHPGGCHFAIADGSVHFLSEYISSDVLAKLTTRAGGEPVAAGDF